MVYPHLPKRLGKSLAIGGPPRYSCSVPRKIHGVRKKIVKRTQTFADGSKRTTPYTYWIADLHKGLDANGKRVRQIVYCQSQDEAVEALRDNLVRYGTTKKAPPGKIQTLTAYLANWLIEVRSSVAPTTYRSYEQTIKNHVLKHINGAVLTEFDADAARALYRKLRDIGTSASMCKRVHTILRIALNAAVMERAILTSPLLTVKAPKHNSRPIESLTAEQARAFLEAARDHRLEGLFTVAVTHGLREGECFGLRWIDVDIPNRTVQVRQSIREVNGSLSVSTPKNGRTRLIEMGSLAAAAMAKRQKLAKAEGHGSEFCFTTATGQLLRKSNFLRSDFAKVREKAGLSTSVRFHDLRHTAASLALRNGVSARVVMETLGHADIATTLRTYSHTTPALHREAATKMDDLLSQR